VSLNRIINVPSRGIGSSTMEEVTRWAQEMGLPLYAALQAIAAGEVGDVKPGIAPRAVAAIERFVSLMGYLIEQAEKVLADGEGDIAGLARQALADPDWFEKVRSGRGDEVRLFLYTNYCEALDQRHRQVICEPWDRENLQKKGIAMSRDGKRRLVAPRWKK